MYLTRYKSINQANFQKLMRIILIFSLFFYIFTEI
jgi:uncharacterized membrane protein